MIAKFIACWFLLISVCISANGYVYRGDYREPKDIFVNGFSSHGGDRNLYRHVRGETCMYNGETSGFVATSESREFSLQWMQHLASEERTGGAEYNGDGLEMYIYTIRPTSNFFSVQHSLNHFYQVSHNPIYSNLLSSYTSLSVPDEYVAVAHIPPSQIWSADYYTIADDDSYTYHSTTYNPNYIASDTSFNSDPYPYQDCQIQAPAQFYKSSSSGACSSMPSCMSWCFDTSDDFMRDPVQWGRSANKCQVAVFF